MSLLDTYERRIASLVAYVEHDLETADTDYVREVLYDVCGMTDEDLARVGLGYLIIEEDD